MKARLLVCILVLLSPSSMAERLDDNLSRKQQFDLDLDWKYSGNTEGLDERQLNALTAEAPYVEIRLNTAPFVGRRGSIYISLPIDIRGTNDSTALRMSWETNGLFASGAVSAGNRAKLFEGRITEAVMTDVFKFTFDIDARQVYNSLRFQPVFDIETF